MSRIPELLRMSYEHSMLSPDDYKLTLVSKVKMYTNTGGIKNGII